MTERRVCEYGIKPSDDSTKSYYQEWKNLESEAEPGDIILFDEEGRYPWKQYIPDITSSRNHVAARITKPLTIRCVPGAVIWNTGGGASFAVQPPMCSYIDDEHECFQYQLYPNKVTLWQWAKANNGGTCRIFDHRVIPDEPGTLPIILGLKPRPYRTAFSPQFRHIIFIAQ